MRSLGRPCALLAGVALASLTLVGGPQPAATAMTPPDAVVAAPVPARAARPAITKVLTFVVENHSLRQMKASMPYVYGLAKKYAYADHYRAITHPSLPNYLAMVSGGTQGVTDDGAPAEHPLTGQTVFDQALSLGRTATVYADAMTEPCQLTSAGRYAVKHNPWAYFTDGRAACLRNDVPVDRLAADAAAGTLPHAGMVIPDLVHDAHDAGLRTADAWLRSQIKLVRAGPDWRSGHLAIVVTADEDDFAGNNTVLTVVASRYQVHKVVHRPLTHYSLTALYDAVLGAQPLGQAAGAPSMVRTFRIRVAPGG
jgi:hypothetical protein